MTPRTSILRIAVPLAIGLAALALSPTACGTTDEIPAACGAKLIFGDLVLSEVMGNPTGKDDGQEWFELHNATSGDVDLKGVKITLSRLDGSSDKTWKMPSLVVAAGGYVVVGNADNATRPPFMDVGYGNKLSDMVNAGAKFVIKCNTKVVDEAEVGEAKEGVAWQLSELTMDASANDKAENWCPASVLTPSPTPTIWADLKGTPGKANRPCAVPGKCMVDGEARDLRTPKAGQLLLNEVMFDPDENESDREWIEVRATADVDLNDLHMGKVKDDVPLAPAFTVTSADCLVLAKGEIALFARETGKHLNGGLPDTGVTDYDDLSMTNGKGNGVWVGAPGVFLDKVSWKSSKNGYSLARDPAKSNTWCVATDKEPYGWAGMFGTPGKANPPCP